MRPEKRQFLLWERQFSPLRPNMAYVVLPYFLFVLPYDCMQLFITANLGAVWFGALRCRTKILVVDQAGDAAWMGSKLLARQRTPAFLFVCAKKLVEARASELCSNILAR